MSASEIRDWFVADHLRLESLLERAQREIASNDFGLAHEHWSTFAETLAGHMDLEERYLIPQLDDSAARLARTLYEEHRYLRARCLGLANSIQSKVARADEIQAFGDEFRAHASHEDRMLYAWADRHMPPAAHTELLSTLEASGKR